VADLPADAWPAGELLEWADDDARVVHDFLNETTRPYTDAENTAADERAARQASAENHRALVCYATDALADNRAFLDLTAPTDAQTLAQMQALTRQMNALARLTLNDFSGRD
jgi:hypothetical protein